MAAEAGRAPDDAPSAATRALDLAGIALLVFAWWRYVQTPEGFDAHAYWALDIANPYAAGIVGATDFFPYSPAFAQVLLPLTGLTFEAFYGVWTAISLLCVWYLVGPVTGAALVLVFPPVTGNISTGNIHLMMAAAIVAGFRYPSAWAFVLLSKVTSGVGLLYFAVRREWRTLALAIATAAAIAAASFVVAPELWFQWFQLLRSNASAEPINFRPLTTLPVILRIAVAAVVVAWGARTNRPWTVPVAAMIALPVFWTIGLSMLAGVISLAPRYAEVRRRFGLVVLAIGSPIVLLPVRSVVALTIATFVGVVLIGLLLLRPGLFRKLPAAIPRRRATRQDTPGRGRV